MSTIYIVPSTATITNRYDTGNLSVSKQVTGNLASTTQLFDIDVEFIASEDKTVLSDITYSGGSDAAASGTIAPTDWSATAAGAPSKAKVTIKIKHGETVTFSNIPEGITYTVIEDSKHKVASEINSGDDSKGYTATDEVLNALEIICDATSSVTITNTKGTDINTGISLDSLPYIIALAVVAVGVVVFLLRRRRREDD